MIKNEKIGNDLEVIRAILEKNEIDFEEFSGQLPSIVLLDSDVVLLFDSSCDLESVGNRD